MPLDDLNPDAPNSLADDHETSKCECQPIPSEQVADLVDALRALVARRPVRSDELLTADELGELLRMSPRTLRDMASARAIPHHRIGKHFRFSKDDISAIFDATKVAPHRISRRFKNS